MPSEAEMKLWERDLMKLGDAEYASSVLVPVNCVKPVRVQPQRLRSAAPSVPVRTRGNKSGDEEAAWKALLEDVEDEADVNPPERPRSVTVPAGSKNGVPGESGFIRRNAVGPMVTR